MNLGVGSAPAWSPDDSAIAFIQISESANGPAHVARIAVAGIDDWHVRDLTEIIDPDFAAFGDVARLPLVQWTGDGAAIYWLDGAGAHVVDVASGKSVNLARILPAASDLRWQPTGG